MKVGDKHKTRGGWDVVIIWRTRPRVGEGCLYVIHRPGDILESAPILHGLDGKAMSLASVGEPPSYGQHPADIIDLTEEDNDE